MYKKSVRNISHGYFKDLRIVETASEDFTPAENINFMTSFGSVGKLSSPKVSISFPTTYSKSNEKSRAR